MIYLIGGAPRVGKSILCQQVAVRLGLGWISTDVLEDLLRFKQVEGIKTTWDASPEAITAAAEWFYPCLERFVWGIQSMSDGYVIEGVDFLPAHAARLAEKFTVRAVFLGCSAMDLERFDRYPGRSKGYVGLPVEMRRQFAGDIPGWSAFIRQEAERWGFSYIDMATDFEQCLIEAEVELTK